MLNIRKEKDKGDILISENAIAQLVIDQIQTMRGRVLPATSKGKRISPVKKVFGNEQEDSVQIKVKGNDLSIRVYVIVRIGVSISKTLDMLIEKIKQSVEESTGVAPSSVSVVVSGVLSKNIARRNMEVRKKYGID